MAGPTRFPFLPVGGWRDDGACSRHHDLTLWDASVAEDGQEPVESRARRHAEAKRICWTKCEVRAQCSGDVELGVDEGVRGGHVMPLLIAVRNGQGSARDVELIRLMRAGVLLDEAAPIADRLATRGGRPPKEKTSVAVPS